MTDYITLLKQNDLKATFQRMNILKTIEAYGHISIEVIYDEVVKIHPSLSLATVYKNIILMLEKGVLVEVPMTGKKAKYELAKEDHIHLVCTQCSEVEDKPHSSSADAIFSFMSKEDNFTLNKQQINLYGVCKKCKIRVAS